MKFLLALLPAVAYGLTLTICSSSTTCEGSSCVTVTYPENTCVKDSAGTSSGKVTTSGSTATFSGYANADCSGTASSTVQYTLNQCQVSGTTSAIMKSGCYSPAAEVELENGQMVRMKDIHVGDKIRTVVGGRLAYERVFRVSFHEESMDMGFLRLTTASGHALELTDDHYLHVGRVDLDQLTPAGKVKVGDVLFVRSGDQVKPSAVVRVERVTRRGAYNIHTVSGNMMVNGVLSTHYTGESGWRKDYASTLAPWLYTTLEMLPTSVRNQIQTVDVRKP